MAAVLSSVRGIALRLGDSDSAKSNWIFISNGMDAGVGLSGNLILMESYLTSNTVQVRYAELPPRVQQELADHLPDDPSSMDGR